MKLQALTVSVNYSDFLVHTLQENKKLFDKWVIVTDLSDTKTKELCDREGVFCLQTDVFYTKGLFNKYAGINEGLQYIDNDSWVLFLDSDIVLHYSTRRIIENLQPDPSYIYGMDRLNCEGLQKWIDFKQGRGILKENWMLTAAGLEFGARLVHHYGHAGENGRFEGWRPLGYFQLCHRTAFEAYPQNSLGADNCDLEFARLWPRSHRILIPEIYVVHLESLKANKGQNWYGRKSQPFELESYKQLVTADHQIVVATPKTSIPHIEITPTSVKVINDVPHIVSSSTTPTIYEEIITPKKNTLFEKIIKQIIKIYYKIKKFFTPGNRYSS